MSKIGFTPIKLEKYVDLHVRANPGTSKREFTKSLKEALSAYKNGVGCLQCGQPIWVIGSAATGVYMCFSCHTGEALPDDDYEIDEACT